MTVDLLWVLLGFGGWISRSRCLVGLCSRDDKDMLGCIMGGCGGKSGCSFSEGSGI